MQIGMRLDGAIDLQLNLKMRVPIKLFLCQNCRLILLGIRLKYEYTMLLELCYF